MGTNCELLKRGTYSNINHREITSIGLIRNKYRGLNINRCAPIKAVWCIKPGGPLPGLWPLMLVQRGCGVAVRVRQGMTLRIRLRALRVPMVSASSSHVRVLWLVRKGPHLCFTLLRSRKVRARKTLRKNKAPCFGCRGGVVLCYACQAGNDAPHPAARPSGADGIGIVFARPCAPAGAKRTAPLPHFVRRSKGACSKDAPK